MATSKNRDIINAHAELTKRTHQSAGDWDRELRLKYIGRDSWKRPVYEDRDGKLWKDVDPRVGRVPRLCSVLNNDFDGEPDTPLEVMERYKGARIIFEHERKTW